MKLTLFLILLSTTFLGLNLINNESFDKNDSSFEIKEFLTPKELNNFISKAPKYDYKAKAKPFDSISFNKVIAYDFEQYRGHHYSIIKESTGEFVSTVTHQKVVAPKQFSKIVARLTDTNTYGGTVAACFDPHTAFILFKDDERVMVIDICMGCNYLSSTIEIPATQHHIQYDTINGETYEWAQRGFSKEGRKGIIEIGKMLGLDYGKPGFISEGNPFDE